MASSIAMVPRALRMGGALLSNVVILVTDESEVVGQNRADNDNKGLKGQSIESVDFRYSFPSCIEMSERVSFMFGSRWAHNGVLPKPHSLFSPLSIADQTDPCYRQPRWPECTNANGPVNKEKEVEPLRAERSEKENAKRKQR
jgi:hypothetical protein